MMKQGMLWYDDSSSRSLEEKIGRAVSYYQSKYGGKPNVCYIHPAYLPEAFLPNEPIRVVPAQDILPHHLWLGVAAAADVA